MSRSLLIRKRAECDLAEAAEWYDDQQAGLGGEFLLEVKATLRFVCEAPDRFTRVCKQPEVRKALTRRFPFRIFFVAEPEKVIVIAAVHAARHDRHWRERI